MIYADEIYPDFDYDNLQEKYALETPAQITARRQGNWTLFKTICDLRKLRGETVNLPDRRIEMYHIAGQKITMNVGDKLTISGNAYEMVFYPFVPRQGYNYVFDMVYGSELTIIGGTIRTAQRMNYFESYQCVLKEGGPRVIKILGTVRNNFWETLTTGQEIIYTWNQLRLGKTTTIVSWDKVAATITVNSDLVGDNNLPTQTWVGFNFVEGVSEADYVDHGKHWVYHEMTNPWIFNFINNGPIESTGPDTVINLTDTKLENWSYPLLVTSGAFKINLKGTVEISKAEIGFSCFARSQLNHQSILGPDATLIMRDCGILSVGSLDVISSGNIWGSGGYVHPTVIVQIDKFRGYNNPAFTFRQYSASIRITCPVDYYSWFHDFQCDNSGEGDLKTSNCMPMEVDYFRGDKQLSIGGRFVLKAGVIGPINFSSLLYPPDYAETFVQINKAIINGRITIGWAKLVAEFTDIEINNSDFFAEVASVIEEKIKNDGQPIRSLRINNCRYLKPVGSTIQTYVPGQPIPDGDSASSFLRAVRFLEIKIDGMKTDYLKGVFFQQSTEQVIPPNDKVIIHLDHSEINTSNFYNDNPNSPRFLPGQIQGIETTVLNYFDWVKRVWVKLTGNWNVP